MSVVRLGAVEYLNARPLVFRLDRQPRFDLRFDWPSRCAALLHEGAIDLGLVPSIEYLRPPDSARGTRAYHIVPDLAVASRGAVASVAIYTTKPMGDVRSLGLDTSSRTSVALTRVLSARVFRIQPDLRALGPDLASMLAACDAALLIGDKALLSEQTSQAVVQAGGFSDSILTPSLSRPLFLSLSLYTLIFYFISLVLLIVLPLLRNHFTVV